jgi:integrase
MARRVRDTQLESRAARSKLKPSGKPYYRSIGQGLHIGYRKGQTEGKWVLRQYLGEQDYKVETIAVADDIRDSDGDQVLNFWQAQDRVRERSGKIVYAGPYRVRDAVEAYLAELGPARAYEPAIRFKLHVLPKLGDLHVQALTAEILRDWHRGLVKHGDAEATRKSQSTANRVLTNLKAALNLAFLNGKAGSDAAWRRVKPFKNVERSRNRYLSIAECKRLLNACDPTFRPLVRAGLETGARYGELIRLTVGDYNPDSGTVHIRKSKSGKERHVILTDDGRAFFDSLTVGRAPSELMFGEEWKRDNQTFWMKKAVKAAKISPPISFHGTRHTYASLAVMAGMPLMVLARNLGHVDTRMVEKHYGHLAPSYVVDQVRKFAPKFGKVEGNVKALR